VIDSSTNAGQRCTALERGRIRFVNVGSFARLEWILALLFIACIGAVGCRASDPIAGTYIHERALKPADEADLRRDKVSAAEIDRIKEHMRSTPDVVTLRPDGTVTFQVGKAPIVRGTWTHVGARVTLRAPNGETYWSITPDGRTLTSGDRVMTKEIHPRGSYGPGLKVADLSGQR